MRTVLVVITDGRQPPTIIDTMESAENYLRADFDARYVIDDSGDPAYAEWLDRLYLCVHHEERRGMAGAVRSAWETALRAGADYVFHLEDDFIFTRKVKVNNLAQILHCNPHLAEISLKRGPVNEHEDRYGGFIETDPDAYYDRSCESGQWVEHRKVFSFNPCLIPRRAIEDALANPGDGVERGITDALLAMNYSFAIYGTKADEPRVCHTGTNRRSQGWRV
jgi:hypothetical protein